MKDRAILTIKGLAIIGVVCHHIGNRRFDEFSSALIMIIPAVFSWSVMAFLTTAGWLHAYADERTPRGCISFISAKFRRLLIPFIALVVLYSIIWQALDFSGLTGIGGGLSSNFFDKIGSSFPLVENYNPISEQLYFLPLLFLISVVVHCSFRFFGQLGIYSIIIFLLLIGVLVSIKDGNSGLSLSTLYYGTFCYVSGFLMFKCRGMQYRFVVVYGVSLFLILCCGIEIIPKIFPLVLLESMYRIGLDRCELLSRLGEASGTIFAYHAPFPIHGLIILTSFLPIYLHFVGAILSALSVIVVFALFHFRLCVTKFKWVTI
jgi:hypothetical protein